MLEGLIVKNITNKYFVKVNDNIYECLARGKFKQDSISPVVGDLVKFEILDEQKNTGIINDIVERKNYIRRPKMANISEIIFVVSTKFPKADLLMLDKQLAFAEFMNIKSKIIVNKIDLGEEIARQIEKTYTEIGYDVVLTNAISKEGIEKIIDDVNEKKKIIVLAGNSGVGKSSLINSLFNREITIAGEVSQKSKRGKNTTTITSLYEVKKNVYIADTPGFSTFDIEEIESSELGKFFIEFNQYIHKCEYQGCAHIKEKKCGIKQAVEENKISNNRYQNYIKIYEDLKYKEEHKKW